MAKNEDTFQDTCKEGLVSGRGRGCAMWRLFATVALVYAYAVLGNSGLTAATISTPAVLLVSGSGSASVTANPPPVPDPYCGVDGKEYPYSFSKSTYSWGGDLKTPNDDHSNDSSVEVKTDAVLDGSVGVTVTDYYTAGGGAPEVTIEEGAVSGSFSVISIGLKKVVFGGDGAIQMKEASVCNSVGGDVISVHWTSGEASKPIAYIKGKKPEISSFAVVVNGKVPSSLSATITLDGTCAGQSSSASATLTIPAGTHSDKEVASSGAIDTGITLGDTILKSSFSIDWSADIGGGAKAIGATSNDIAVLMGQPGPDDVTSKRVLTVAEIANGCVDQTTATYKIFKAHWDCNGLRDEDYWAVGDNQKRQCITTAQFYKGAVGMLGFTAGDANYLYPGSDLRVSEKTTPRGAETRITNYYGEVWFAPHTPTSDIPSGYHGENNVFNYTETLMYWDKSDSGNYFEGVYYWSGQYYCPGIPEPKSSKEEAMDAAAKSLTWIWIDDTHQCVKPGFPGVGKDLPWKSIP